MNRIELARPGWERRLTPCLLAVTLSCLSGFGGAPLTAADTAKEATYKLKEVSVLEESADSFLRGQTAVCQETPFKEVKFYPKFGSQKPIYGSIRFAADRNQPDSGQLYYFAIDEGNGTGKGYDLLFLDLDQDLDLRNDEVSRDVRSPPDRAKFAYENIKAQVIFDPIKIPFDGGEAGKIEASLMPRLLISNYGEVEYKQVMFVRTRLFVADIQVGGRDLRARLGNDYLITGRLDSPQTALILSQRNSADSFVSWWGGDRLIATHNINGRLYAFATTPTGDQLIVRPYSGDLGVFTLGAGGRGINHLEVIGSLEASDRCVAVGADAEQGRGFPTLVESCQLPAGDYLPTYLNVNLGTLRISLSQNYHSDGKPRDRAGRAPVYGICIRKDKPFVLDFSNQPEVMFASPAKGQRIKPGESLEVKAVLVDPKLDFMIRGLDDTKQKPASSGRPVSLDPKVVITRKNGEKVAEGVMPFG
jgi:hypothetical protein